MGATSSLALKFLQWFVRGVQFCCAAIVLGIFSYFLATLSNHDLHIRNSVRAVEGISGAAVIYTAVGLLLLCCLAGHPATSLIAMILDLCFIVGFIYIATVNRGGADSCRGHVNTVYGSGDAGKNVADNGHGGFTSLPNLHTACKLETACLAVSIVAAVFFVLSILVEVVLVRHRRKERRFGPSPANDYTSGYGKQAGARRGGLLGLLGLRKKQPAGAAGADGTDPNALPMHASPDDVRASYATDQTRVGAGAGAAEPYPKYGEAGYGDQLHQPAGAAGGYGGGQTAGVVGGGGYPGSRAEAGAGAVPASPYQGQAQELNGGYRPATYQPVNYEYGDGVYNTRR